MELDKGRPANGGEGCLVGVVRIPVKIVAVLVVLPVRVVWDLLVAFGRMLNRRLLGPVGRGLAWCHRKVLLPVARALGLVLATLLKLVFVWPWVGLGRYVLAPVGQGLARLGRALTTHVLAPIGGALLRYLLRPAGQGISRLARAAYAHLLTPLGHGLGRLLPLLGKALFVWPWVALWRHVLAPVGRGAAWSARWIGAGLGWLARALFVWPWVALWRYVVTPVAVGAYRYVLAPVGRGLYTYVLTPLGHLLRGAWYLAGRISRALGRGLVRLWRGLVVRPARWARRRIATPVGHLVREVWRTSRTAVREARAEVRRALFGGPPGEPVRSRARTLGSTKAAGNTPAPEISLHERQG
ncbi:hypothetical protein [Streptomyces sp. NPDC048272]|uniref:hypothetical protein n=1 Tax=Streptomyces sp. NPDC048272 TaxID=3154616 RepID=UPI003443CE53